MTFVEKKESFTVFVTTPLFDALSVTQRKKQGALACAALEQILEKRKILEIGDWAHWHRGEKR